VHKTNAALRNVSRGSGREREMSDIAAGKHTTPSPDYGKLRDFLQKPYKDGVPTLKVPPHPGTGRLSEKAVTGSAFLPYVLGPGALVAGFNRNFCLHVHSSEGMADLAARAHREDRDDAEASEEVVQFLNARDACPACRAGFAEATDADRACEDAHRCARAYGRVVMSASGRATTEDEAYARYASAIAKAFADLLNDGCVRPAHPVYRGGRARRGAVRHRGSPAPPAGGATARRRPCGRREPSEGPPPHPAARRRVRQPAVAVPPARAHGERAGSGRGHPAGAAPEGGAYHAVRGVRPAAHGQRAGAPAARAGGAAHRPLQLRVVGGGPHVG